MDDRRKVRSGSAGYPGATSGVERKGPMNVELLAAWMGLDVQLVEDATAYLKCGTRAAHRASGGPVARAGRADGW
jgi:hypothetical protein